MRLRLKTGLGSGAPDGGWSHGSQGEGRSPVCAGKAGAMRKWGRPVMEARLGLLFLFLFQLLTLHISSLTVPAVLGPGPSSGVHTYNSLARVGSNRRVRFRAGVEQVPNHWSAACFRSRQTEELALGTEASDIILRAGVEDALPRGAGRGPWSLATPLAHQVCPRLPSGAVSGGGSGGQCRR